LNSENVNYIYDKLEKEHLRLKDPIAIDESCEKINYELEKAADKVLEHFDMKLNENQKDYFVNEFKVYILLCLYPSNSNPNESTDIKLKIKHCVESGFRKKYAKK